MSRRDARDIGFKLIFSYTFDKEENNDVLEEYLATVDADDGAYIREIYKNGDIVVSTGKKDALLGALHAFYLQPYTASITTFDPYIVEIINDTVVRTGPANNNTIVSSLKKHEMYTIISERQGWGKLKNGQGWINLSYTKKI